MEGQPYYRPGRQERIENCTFVKTILMLLVVLYHGCVYWTGSWFDRTPLLDSQFLAVFAKWLNSFHVYGFALVSGYLYSFGRNEIGKYQNRKRFLIDKAKRLIIPFYFAVIVWVIPIQQLFFHNDIEVIIKKYLLAENPNQLWFLWMLFIVFVIICYIVEIVDKSYIAALIISLCGYGIYITVPGKVPHYFQIIMAMQFLSVFLVGYYMRKIEPWKVPWIAWVVLDIVLFYVYEFLPRNVMALKLIHYGSGFFLHIIGGIMAFETLQVFACRIDWRRSKTLILLSSCSMPMYMFHQQIVYFSIAVFNGRIHPLIHAGINFLVAIVGSLLISVILMKWRTTRFLIGAK